MKDFPWFVYWKERKNIFGMGMVLLIFLNLYLGVFCATHLYGQDLIYLNILLLFFCAGICWFDYERWKKRFNFLSGEAIWSEEEKEKLLGKSLSEFLYRMEEETRAEQKRQKEELMELSDYVTRWSHEAKLPLASLKLMNERNEDFLLKAEMESCLARLETLIQTVIVGSKLQRPENDVHFEQIVLKDAVKEAVKNQSWYLIHEGFEIRMDLSDVTVCSDKRWLVYLLDQLIGNAVKYKGKHPAIRFFAREDFAGEEGETVITLSIEDNGIGILKEDLPYIFLRGYVGKNHRNGDYRSTGMGLYFVKKMSEMMNLSIKVFSEPGEGCRFELQFRPLTFLLDSPGKC